MGGAHKHFAQAIAIHVAEASQGEARFTGDAVAIDGHVRQRQGHLSADGGQHHVGPVDSRSPDEQVVEAISVHVTGASHAGSSAGKVGLPDENGVRIVQVDLAGNGATDQEGSSCLGATLVVPDRPDQNVIGAVAVGVPCKGHGPACRVGSHTAQQPGVSL